MKVLPILAPQIMKKWIGSYGFCYFLYMTSSNIKFCSLFIFWNNEWNSWGMHNLILNINIGWIKNNGDTYTWINNIFITNVIWFHSNIISNILWRIPNICIIHPYVNVIFIANSRAYDFMFSQFVVYSLLLLKLYIIFFLNKLICISCMLYAAFHVEWSPLRVCSLSKKGINNNNCSL